MSQCVADSLQATPIGAVASDWEMGVIGDYVTALQAGVSVNAVETDSGCAEGELGVLKSSAVLQGRFYANQHKVVVAEDAGRVATSVVADRIIISRMNTPALVGESGYVTKDEPNLFLPDRLWQTEPSERPHSQRWLSYWLQHPGVRRLIAAGATGTSNSMKNISKETVLSLPVPLTPLSEQQKIAAVLTAVDDKLDVIARQIEATQTLKQGLMQTLFSRGVGTQDATGRWIPHTEFKDSELGEIPVEWQVVQLQTVSEVIRGASPRPQGDPRYYGGDVPRLMGADVTRDGKWVTPKIDFLTEEGAKRSRPCPRGTLTIICSGDVGVPSFLAVDACIHDGFLALINIDESQANKEYLYHIIYSVKQRFYASATHGGVFTNLTTGILKEFLVPLPPLAEQQRISSILDVADEKISTELRKQKYYQALKRGLMQKLLTGEWRVKLDSTSSTA